MAPPAVLKKSGVIYGKDVKDLFDYAQEKGFAIPAINVTSSSTVVAALEAARDNKAPIILQTSQGGAAYFAGKGVDNKTKKLPLLVQLPLPTTSEPSLQSTVFQLFCTLITVLRNCCHGLTVC